MKIPYTGAKGWGGNEQTQPLIVPTAKTELKMKNICLWN
jgi:hypothetical protein